MSGPERLDSGTAAARAASIPPEGDVAQESSLRAGRGGAPASGAAASLRRNVAWTLLGNFTYGACQWAMLILLAKIGTPEAVGRFALGFALAAPVFMAASMNLRNMLATDAHRDYEFGDYLGLRLSSAAVATAVMVAVAGLFYRGETALTIVVVALAKSTESVGDVYLGFMQRHEHMEWVSRSLIIKGAAAMAGLLVGLRVGGSVPAGVAGVALAWATTVACYDIRNASRLARLLGHAPLRPQWRWPVQWKLAWLALPLGTASFLGSLQTNIPRLFVERLLGTRELGFFAAAGYLIVVGGRVMTALGESAGPRLANYHAQRDPERFSRLLLQMVGIAAGIGIAAIAVALAYGKPLLALIYLPEYADQARVLATLMLAAALNYVGVVLGYAMTASRVLRAQPAVLVAASLVTAAACWFLVPRYGNQGAALSMCLGSLVQVLGNAHATRAMVQRLGSA